MDSLFPFLLNIISSLSSIFLEKWDDIWTILEGQMTHETNAIYLQMRWHPIQCWITRKNKRRWQILFIIQNGWYIGWELVLLLPIQRQGNRLMRPCMGTVKINMLHNKTLSQCLPWCPRLWRSQPFQVSANLDVPQVLFCPWNKWPPSISMDHRSELLISKWGNQTFKEPNIAHG